MTRHLGYDIWDRKLCYCANQRRNLAFSSRVSTELCLYETLYQAIGQESPYGYKPTKKYLSLKSI